MISLRQHVDRAGGIGHDLLSQPVLEGRDHPVIAIVDDQEGVPRLVLLLDHHLPNELRPLNPERVVGRRAAIAAAPAILPGGPPITCSSGSCGIGWSLSLTWNVVAPVPRILRGSIPSREPESRDLPAGCRSRRPLNRWERHVTGMIYPEKLDLPRRFFWARPIGLSQNGYGHGRSARAKMATDQWPQSSSYDRKTDPPIPDLPSRKLGDIYIYIYIYIHIHVIYIYRHVYIYIYLLYIYI